MRGGAYKVTKFLSPKLTVKATRKKYKADKGRIPKNRAVDIVFTVGPPNYEEREQIKRAKKAGETLDTIAKIPNEAEELKRRLAKAKMELADAKAKRANAIRRACL